MHLISEDVSDLVHMCILYFNVVSDIYFLVFCAYYVVFLHVVLLLILIYYEYRPTFPWQTVDISYDTVSFSTSYLGGFPLINANGV